jgi:hypothetical protein
MELLAFIRLKSVLNVYRIMREYDLAGRDCSPGFVVGICLCGPLDTVSPLTCNNVKHYHSNLATFGFRANDCDFQLGS